jgi:hypothetical protein
VNRFAAFGIPISDLDVSTDVLARVVADVHQTGGWHRSPDGRLSSCAWVDQSGARLDLLLDENQRVVCATPQLEGCRGSQVVRVLAVVDEPSAEGCPGCAVVDADLLLAGHQVCPVSFAPVDIAPIRQLAEAAAAQRATVQVSLVLVADAVSRAGGSDHAGKTNLIHIGQLPVARSRATVRAACRVTAVASRRSSFGYPFWCLQVECLGHCFDLVVAPEDLPAVHEGDVLNVSAWLCGQAWW